MTMFHDFLADEPDQLHMRSVLNKQCVASNPNYLLNEELA